MKYFNKAQIPKPGDNTTPGWQSIVQLFQGKAVKGNVDFLGIERTLPRARNDYDEERRNVMYRLTEKKTVVGNY